MKKFSVLVSILAVFTIIALLPCEASAQDDIHSRIHQQQKRINQGVASGSLTNHEAEILQDNLNHIRHRYDRYKMDGMLTRREVRKLQHMLDKNSRMIQKLKHNERVRRLY